MSLKEILASIRRLPVLLKIGGHPPVVLRPLRKALLAHSGIDTVSKFSIAAIRELPIRILDPNAPAPIDAADKVVSQTVLYGYVVPTTDGGTRYATARESVFQDLFRALWTSINVDHEREGLPALAGVADIDFAAYGNFRRTPTSVSVSTTSSRLPPWARASSSSPAQKAMSRGFAKHATKTRLASGSSLRRESITT